MFSDAQDTHLCVELLLNWSAQVCFVWRYRIGVNAPDWIVFHLLSASRLSLSVVVASFLLGGSLHSGSFSVPPFVSPVSPTIALRTGQADAVICFN